ncbi:hypothetical protein DPMN_003757 [Dreissena polymorpha]|uniref:Uncharacterized protein n=1 Tax=Dreissena polymorpha TaxID=45954 RepID=A0A9D4MPH7_DREPO|nr:hypothetical protein DPMN_003757 [Dreissena polymorpha]
MIIIIKYNSIRVATIINRHIISFIIMDIFIIIINIMSNMVINNLIIIIRKQPQKQ